MVENSFAEDLKKDPEVQSLIKSIVSEDGYHIVNHLMKVDKADEFEIAEALDEEVNFVRSVMYKMYSHKLVSYTRRRDAERGWYIYTWKLLFDKMFKEIISRKKTYLNELTDKLDYEKNKEQSFHCKKCSIIVDFSKAMELSFSCFACGSMLEPLDNDNKVENLDKKINELKESLGLLKKKLNATED